MSISKFGDVKVRKAPRLQSPRRSIGESYGPGKCSIADRWRNNKESVKGDNSTASATNGDK